MLKLQKIRLSIQIAAFAIGFTTFFQTNFKIFEILFIILTVISGAFYCGWACPFGMIQDIFGHVGNLFIKKKLKPSRQIQKSMMYFRYLLAIIIIFLASNQIWNFYPYNPRLIFFNVITLKNIKIMSVAILVFFVLGAIFFDRLFCNYFCPKGAKLGVFSLLRVFTIKRNKETCLQCRKCDSVCPMNIEISGKQDIKSAQCINCLKCLSICPKQGTLKIGIIKQLLRFFKRK
jgi:polyferredoxin